MRHVKREQATIRQVAKEAGVSTQTVSRVINNRPEVLPETRDRVQKVIARLGYQPNAIARSLTQRRSHTLGVVASGLKYFGPSNTLNGIESGANELGFSILLNLLHQPETDQVDQIVNSLISRRVEGIIWAVPEIGTNRSWLRTLMTGLTIPVIFLDMHPDDQQYIVNVDNFSGGRMAAEHLLSQGYEKIGMISGPMDWWSARERQRGWKETILAAGIPVNDDQIVEGDWSAASGEQGLYQLLENRPDLEAVFAGNDQMALGLLRGARRLGKRVPGDLAVVGFDDIPESGYFCPALTTIRQELFELGTSAVQVFVRILKARQDGTPVQEPHVTLLQPKLIVRESSVAGMGKETNPA